VDGTAVRGVVAPAGLLKRDRERDREGNCPRGRRKSSAREIDWRAV